MAHLIHGGTSAREKTKWRLFICVQNGLKTFFTVSFTVCYNISTMYFPGWFPFLYHNKLVFSMASKAVFLHLGIIDILDWIILCCGGLFLVLQDV